MSAFWGAVPHICIGGYFALGFVQLFAIAGGLQVLGLSTALSYILALGVAFVPFVGGGAGVYGATLAWGWTVTQGVLLFFGPHILLFIPPLLLMLTGGVFMGAKALKDRRKQLP